MTDLGEHALARRTFAFLFEEARVVGDYEFAQDCAHNLNYLEDRHGVRVK